ncbi:polysaccharide deacetylase family protein [Natronobacterium texcoconense]|uniref:Polysaccharide deacetylase n=1 Tax=Natronobacterium texcoconense TaxID=1095778 RepID=A0A1H1F8I1_NATTX|nr:polysaccharide deacetylase family protein [Natronobacterium texcoconense]SDQ97069.1 hypothetical protein SAMN04489842_1860 [Natronobacterium texcoconense]
MTEFDRALEADALPEDAEFALCLTHDVDRPYKGLRGLYYATQERPAYHLRTVLGDDNPYWQFEEIMALEDDLGVRSAFYFLNEQHLFRDRPVRDWLSPAHWVQHLGRYDLTEDDLVDVVERLEGGGWEIGLHGSYHTRDDRTRLREEKDVLERVVGDSISGGRQHHLRLSVPETWRHYREIGLEYDASLGSTTACGFYHGYRPRRPFGDDFLVFPLTIMDQALPDPDEEFEAARRACERLLTEAAENDAVMTALWHPRFFSEREFPGYRRLYRWLVERAAEMGAWIGSPQGFCETLESDDLQSAEVEDADGRTRETTRERTVDDSAEPATTRPLRSDLSAARGES